MSSTEDTAVAIVLTTLSAEADAGQLARTLVDEGLAACVNVLAGMRSIYRWNGSVEDDREQQLIIKTSVDAIDALTTRLLALHPYETPELLVIEARAADAYLAWVRDSTRPRR